MPTFPGGIIAKTLNIPIYGIGAGNDVDGQLIIMHDLLGFYQAFRPWFAKCYIPEVIKEFDEYLIVHTDDLNEFGRSERADGFFKLAELAIKRYISDVREKLFPGENFSYPIKPEEIKDLEQSGYVKNQFMLQTLKDDS